MKPEGIGYIKTRTSKALTTVFLIVLSAGCATNFNDYEGASQRAAVANICQKQGLISADDFAHYAELQMGWGARQNMTIVDDGKLRQMYLQKVETFGRWEPRDPSEFERFRLNCAQISVVASRVRGYATQPIQNAPSYTPPITTNCMTTYGWTRCTTN
ncbi:MAG TPA: hypothetical protein PK702_01440 [Burkholderiaceae bacterium]|nr:hypothetical protein [Burkholderiaceae bacterium]